MKTFFLFILLLGLFTHSIVYATEDPLLVPNNKIGIHILFPDEIHEAATLVNSNGGQWGYVTIPIQAGDRNIEKWQKFMDDAKQLKVIPLIRLATEGDYFNTKIWRKPALEDVLDFSNFLSSLSWPTKNKYIIVFNEVNRSDEWGGDVNPEEYAQILSYAVISFKSKSQDFFIISAGLDNAAANVSGNSMVSLDYMAAMEREVPGIFSQIDGLGSHSYPNPAFKSLPTQNNRMSIASFQFEKSLVKKLYGRDLPVFITETGWSNDELSLPTIIGYYKFAFSHVWNDEKIVAITPFLLRAQRGPYSKFSFFRENGDKNELYLYIESIPKINGKPALSVPAILETEINKSRTAGNQIEQEYVVLEKKEEPQENKELLNKSAVFFVKWLLRL